MGIKGRRSNQRHGHYSTVLVLPASLEKGKESTLAANRLILVDPRGEINERDLLDFLETHVEPLFWQWREKNKFQKVEGAVVVDDPSRVPEGAHTGVPIKPLSGQRKAHVLKEAKQ